MAYLHRKSLNVLLNLLTLMLKDLALPSSFPQKAAKPIPLKTLEHFYGYQSTGAVLAQIVSPGCTLFHLLQVTSLSISYCNLILAAH